MARLYVSGLGTLGGTELTGTSLAAMSSRQVRLASAPLATVTDLIWEALGWPIGSPPAWPGAVRRALEPRDLAALSVVFGPGHPPVVPSCLVPRPESYASSFDDELHRVASLSAADLVANLEAEDLIGSDWAVAAKAPRRWLDAYLFAVRRAWSAVAPLWGRASPLIERELERVGVALVTGSFDQILGRLHPKGRVDQDRWFVHGRNAPATIAADFVLVPVLIGPWGSLLGRDDDGAVSYLAYPLPGVQRLTDQSRLPGPEATLDALVGAPRAEILRLLDRPVAAGELASSLLLARSAITYHVGGLERAGLAYRERVGQRVLVRRSARGTALLHLYEQQTVVSGRHHGDFEDRRNA